MARSLASRGDNERHSGGGALKAIGVNRACVCNATPLLLICSSVNVPSEADATDQIG